MTTKTIRTLRTHWQSLRDGDELPLRSEIDPRAMPDVLDSLFILERLNPSDIRVRIAGLTVCEMMGMEVRGLSPMPFFNDNTKGRFAVILGDVMDNPVIARLGLKTKDKVGNESSSEMILLPLRSDFGDVSRIIGCVSAPENGFTAPVRFHVHSVELEPVLQTNTAADNFYGFAEPKVGFIMDGTSSSLRSIIGGAVKSAARSTAKPNYLKVVD